MNEENFNTNSVSQNSSFQTAAGPVPDFPAPSASSKNKKILLIAIISLSFLVFITAVSFLILQSSSPKEKIPQSQPLITPFLPLAPEPAVSPVPTPEEQSSVSESDAITDIEKELNETVIEDFSSDFQDLSSDTNQL